MTWRLITEQDFRERIRSSLLDRTVPLAVGSVTGPGRSGAVASVYASHLLRVPFIPYGSPVPKDLGRLLIIDTAMLTGATIRKAARRYADCDPVVIALYSETKQDKVYFWYERPHPQSYSHERRSS